MDVAAINVTPDEARAKLAEYSAVPYENRSAEDDAIIAGYKQVRRGRQVISLTQTILHGGFHDNGLPRIAVMPATAKQCFAWWTNSTEGELMFADDQAWSVNRGALANEHSVRVRLPAESVPAWDKRKAHFHWAAGRSAVPLVPPQHRIRWPSWRRCYVLWEVESCSRVPPQDPALIRHIRGDLWAVLREWDLTELERAVLAQR